MTRAEKLITYLYDIVDSLVSDTDYQIVANFLDNDINSYAIDRIPVESTIERFVTGDERRQDVFDFRSRFAYSSNQAEQLKNVGFFERFEEIIEEKNLDKDLPDIDGIESIECLNSGSIRTAESTTCEMDVQVRIIYWRDRNGKYTNSI